MSGCKRDDTTPTLTDANSLYSVHKKEQNVNKWRTLQNRKIEPRQDMNGNRIILSVPFPPTGKEWHRREIDQSREKLFRSENKNTSLFWRNLIFLFSKNESNFRCLCCSVRVSKKLFFYFKQLDIQVN